MALTWMERSALEHFLRLSRLTLAVVLLYVWFLAFGADQVQRGLRAEVDRADRRDLSLFRIAWDALQRALLFDLPFSISFVPFSALCRTFIRVVGKCRVPYHIFRVAIASPYLGFSIVGEL